jgi:hypothetical protein
MNRFQDCTMNTFLFQNDELEVKLPESIHGYGMANQD